MKRMNKWKKRKVFWAFGVFLLVMMVLGMVSRGIYGMRLARVEIGKSSAKGLTNTIVGEGTITGGRERPVDIAADFLVEEVCVQTGQQVKKKDVLLRLDKQELEARQKEAERKLALEQAKLSDLNYNQEQSKADAQKEKDRATEDLNRVTAEQDAMAAAAEREYDAANADLASYPSWESYLKEAKQSEEKQAGEAAADFEKQAKESWEAGKKALEESLAEKESALLAARASREREIQTAQRAVEDAGKLMKSESELLLQQEAVSQAKEEVKRYRKLSETGGEILAETTGTVKEIAIVSGARTTEGAELILADGNSGWQFCGSLTQETYRKVEPGDVISIRISNSGTGELTASVSAVRKTQEGEWELSASVDAPELAYGSNGSFTIKKENNETSCCVPLSALYSEDGTDYVLVVQEENTILGTQLRAVKKIVTVIDKNETEAALSGNPLTSEEKLIISSDRIVSPGDVVRPEEV